jgi:hypothetical protein
MKNIFTFIILIIFSPSTDAQVDDNQLLVNIETGIGANHGDLGSGFNMKVLYGTGTSAHFTLTAAAATFNSQNSGSKLEITTNLFDILFGYRQSYNGLFIEPQIGIGQLTGKYNIASFSLRPSTIAAFGAIDLGYTMDRINFGMRFHTGHGIQQKSTGAWYNKDFTYAGFFIGYSLFVNKKYLEGNDE